jgi:hypothetical protein
MLLPRDITIIDIKNLTEPSYSKMNSFSGYGSMIGYRLKNKMLLNDF